MSLRSFNHLLQICAEIDLGQPGWKLEANWRAATYEDGFWFIRVSCPKGVCNVTGSPMPWTGRKWFVSQHSTVSEVVQTALKALLTALEHEAREQFKWCGAPVFDPHLDLEAVRRSLAQGALPLVTRAEP